MSVTFGKLWLCMGQGMGPTAVAVLLPSSCIGTPCHGCKRSGLDSMDPQISKICFDIFSVVVTYSFKMFHNRNYVISLSEVQLP